MDEIPALVPGAVFDPKHLGQVNQADFWRRVSRGVAIPLNAGLGRFPHYYVTAQLYLGQV